MTALKAGDGATATLLAFAALSRRNTWVSGLGRFTVPQPHLEDGSVYRQNRPTLFDLVPVPDDFDNISAAYPWIPAFAGNTMALPGHIRSMKIGGVLRQAIRLAACVYVPRAEAPGLTSPQTPDFSPGEFGCLAHRPIFIAMTDGDPCSSSSNGYSTRCTELRTDRSTTLEPQQTLFSWAEFMAEEPVEAKRKPKPPTASPP